MKVLISEDQYPLQKLMKHMMQQWGYDADIASNGLEAFELARKNRYDLCIMDLQMPVMNGFDAARKMRKELPYVPILAFTGNPAEEKEKCLKAGMDDFLNKLCTASELKQKIAELTVKTVSRDL